MSSELYVVANRGRTICLPVTLEVASTIKHNLNIEFATDAYTIRQVTEHEISAVGTVGGVGVAEEGDRPVEAA